MALEPINSAMTFQAQPLQSTPTIRPVTEKDPAEKPVSDNSGSTTGEAQQVDSQTLVVNGAGQTETGGGNSGGGTAGEGVGKDYNFLEADKQTSDRIKKAVEDLNKRMYNSEAQFGIHEETNRVTIKIVDKDTKEVIKELPPEKTLDMIAKAWELAGIMVDEKR